MNKRPTADIVSDLRIMGELHLTDHEVEIEAADRLEELEADMATMHRTVDHECCERVVKLEAWKAAILGGVDL